MILPPLVFPASSYCSADCYSAECHCSQCRGAIKHGTHHSIAIKISTLRITFWNVVRISVAFVEYSFFVMLGVPKLSDFILNVVMLSAVRNSSVKLKNLGKLN